MILNKPLSMYQLVIAIILWYLSSAWSIILFKRVFGSDLCNIAAGVIDGTMAQLAFGAAISTLIGGPDDRSVDLEVHSQGLSWVVMLHIVGTAATNWVMVAGGASFSQIAKLGEPIITVLISGIILQQAISCTTLMWISLACIGTFLAMKSPSGSPTAVTGSEAIYSGTQLTIICIMACAFPLRNVMTKRIDGDFKGIKLYRFLSIEGTKLLLPLVVCRFWMLPYVAKNSIEAQPTLFISMGTLSAAYNIFSFVVLGQVTAVTHAMLRLGKRIASLMLTIFFLQDFALDATKMFGLLLAFTGLIGHSWIQASSRTHTGKPKPSVGTVTSGHKKQADSLVPKFALDFGAQMFVLLIACASMWYVSCDTLKNSTYTSSTVQLTQSNVVTRIMERHLKAKQETPTTSNTTNILVTTTNARVISTDTRNWTIKSNYNNVHGVAIVGKNNLDSRYIGKFESLKACLAALENITGSFNSCSWFEPTYSTDQQTKAYNGQCYARISTAWTPYRENKVHSGISSSVLLHPDRPRLLTTNWKLLKEQYDHPASSNRSPPRACENRSPDRCTFATFPTHKVLENYTLVTTKSACQTCTGNAANELWRKVFNNGHNFGDAIGPSITEFVAGGNIEKCQPLSVSDRNRRPKALTLGSILHFMCFGSDKTKTSLVWGSGAMGFTKRYCSNEQIKYDVRALRGYLSIEMMHQSKKINDSHAKTVPLGDPAVLLPKLFPKCARNCQPKWKMCVVLHYDDEAKYRSMLEEEGRAAGLSKEIAFFTVADEPAKMLENLLDCALVVSSSLHGIIFAEVFGVPARWLQIQEIEKKAAEQSQGGFKYVDWYSSTRDLDMFISDHDFFHPVYGLIEAYVRGGVPSITSYDWDQIVPAFPKLEIAGC